MNAKAGHGSYKRAAVIFVIVSTALVYFLLTITCNLNTCHDTIHAFLYTSEEANQTGPSLSSVTDFPDRVANIRTDLSSLSMERRYSNITMRAEVDRELDNHALKPIEFLPTYKNPCWYETLPKTTSYDNPYKHYSDELKNQLFTFMERVYNKRRKAGLDWRLRCLPYFYIPGVGKCGTTDLYSEIASHPDIAEPPVKEPMYWNRIRLGTPQTKEGKVNRTLIKIKHMPIPRPFRYYVDLFDKAAEEIRTSAKGPTLQSEEIRGYHNKITGDASPTYIYDFDGWTKLDINKGLTEPRYTIADFIYQLTPQAKIIFILRDPIERLFSAYKFFGEERKSLLSPADFHYRARVGIAKMEACLMKRTVRSCIYDKNLTRSSEPIEIRVGMYQPFMMDWFKVFPRKNIFVTRLEDYGENRTEVLKNLFEFLGLAPLIHKERKKAANQSSVPFKLRNGMRDDTRLMIKQFYQKWNSKLVKFLADKRYQWE